MRRDYLSLLLVLLVAGFMRLGEPGIIEFLHDEAYLSLLAQDLVAGGPFPVTSIPSSVGIPNPPISLYLMAVPYALSSSPQFATLFIAVLNVVGVAVLWLFARRYLGARVAFLAGLAYAVNPWAVLYSRKIWAQDFHTPFVLSGLVMGLYGFRKGKRWAQLLCLPLLFLAFQIHFAAWALLPLYFWLLWSGRKNISWPVLALSLGLVVITLVPFLIGLSETATYEPYRISNAFDRQSRSLSLNADALSHMARLATGLGLETWIAPEQQQDLLANVPPPVVLWLVSGGAVIVGVIATWVRLQRWLAIFLTLWFILPLAVFTPTWTQVYPHYFTASIPALCLLAGIGVVFVADRIARRPPIKALFFAAFGAILLTQAVWWRDLLYYVDTTDTPSGFGTPIHYLLDVRDALADYDDVVVVSDGFEVLYDQEPTAWPVLLRDTAQCVRTVVGSGVAVFPDGPFAVLIAPNAPDHSVDNFYQTPTPLTFPLRPDEGAYTIHFFDSAPEWIGPTLTEIEPVLFDSGAQLIGYHLEETQMYLEWLLPGRRSEDYHYFGHFLDANGERLGQRDNILWPGRFWCEGDRLITWIDIDLPERVETLRAGLYTIEHGNIVNSSVVDSAGNPFASWADIPLEP